MAGTGTATVNFGSSPVTEASFVITDANIGPTNYVEAFVMVDSTADNTVEDHRHAAVSWKLSALPDTGQFTLYVDALVDMCFGTFKIRYAYA